MATAVLCTINNNSKLLRALHSVYYNLLNTVDK